MNDNRRIFTDKKREWSKIIGCVVALGVAFSVGLVFGTVLAISQIQSIC